MIRTKEGQPVLPGFEITPRTVSTQEVTRHLLRKKIAHLERRRQETKRRNRLDKWWDNYMVVLFSTGTDTWLARLARKDGEEAGQNVLRSESIDDDTQILFDAAFDAARSFRLDAVQIVRRMAGEALRVASRNDLDPGNVLNMVTDRANQLAKRWKLSESYTKKLRDEVFDQKRFRV